jgi:P27 family predicted phage terminase small subunit
MKSHRGRKSIYDLIEPVALREQLAPVPRRTRRQPPDHLGEPERDIWKHVLGDYDLSTETAFAVLTTALEAHQRAREAGETVLREGMQVAGRDGQAKVHPLLAVERDARAAWLAAVKQLGLEL